jgi:hypothetical protein
MRLPYRITRPPRALREVRLDNIALVPASLLPFKDEWQSLANDLPAGGVLLSMPLSAKLQDVVRKVGERFESRGHLVKILPPVPARESAIMKNESQRGRIRPPALNRR